MMNTTELGLGQIGQISLCVRDLDRATEFYRDTLGMRHLFANSKMSFFDCEGIRLVLGVREDDDRDWSGSILYFKVDDINQAYQAMLDRGVHFENEPIRVASLSTFDLWMVFFRDSEENLMGLTSEMPKDSDDDSD